MLPSAGSVADRIAPQKLADGGNREIYFWKKTAASTTLSVLNLWM